MGKRHGAKQQKKLAKQKAKRADKRASLARRTSTDPTVRLDRADRWPVAHALVASTLWDRGIGEVILARKELEGQFVFAIFLVDVRCLGVKDAFWSVRSETEFKEIVQQIEKGTGRMRPVSPACVAKIVLGAVEFAESFGFPPHRDFRHASRLLEGIDPAECMEEFEFGRGGRPFYVQGPFESPTQASAIALRAQEAGGHFTILAPGSPHPDLRGVEGEWDEEDVFEDEEDLR
jgi:hypothetical protein